MQPIYRKWDCWSIISNQKYIATFGSGITLLDRITLDIVHHFDGIRYIQGGLFINEDVLMVFTTEQRLYFLQISEKKVLWSCPRPRPIADSGDMRCCQIPGTENVACIVAGKRRLREFFFLLVDHQQQVVEVRELSNCYRVVRSLVWLHTVGLTFLTYEAKGDGKMLYKINVLAQNGDCKTLLEWESTQQVNFCSDNFIFMNDYNSQEPQLSIVQLASLLQTKNTLVDDSYTLPFPSFRAKGPVGFEKNYLPTISWINENNGLLTACTSDWIGVYDFVNKKRIAEYKYANISCGAVIDKKLIIGCTPGVVIESL